MSFRPTPVALALLCALAKVPCEASAQEPARMAGPIRDPGGKIAGAVTVFHDITAFRRERVLREELTAFVVHDLKSPLTSILVLTELLLAETSLAAEDRESVAEIRTAAQTLHQMAIDLLDVQMGEDGHLKPNLSKVGVQVLLEEVAFKAVGGDRTIEFKVAAHDSLHVLADRNLLVRVVSNLVENCKKYGPKGGCIWLDAAAREPGTVRISVRDEGPSVPPELRERIFDKYAKFERDNRGRQSGSRGLGLRMCKVIVEAHGGRIWVEDNVPVGARFCFELPAA